jgi:hypothetical protein
LRQQWEQALAAALEIVGLVLLLGCWIAILPRWRLGLELYLLYMPFAGAVELWLYPAPWSVLVKDFLFAMPAYVGFAMSGELGSSLAGLPRTFGFIALFFIGLVLVQSLNPAGPGLFATAVGIKVWLFYLPMILLGRAYVRDRRRLLRLCWLLVSLMWLPCTVGILQWLLSLAFGYRYAISLFYGAAAFAATQGFTEFNVGVIRIPSTFAFPAQYMNYILCMFVPVVGCPSFETDWLWPKMRTTSLALLCVAGFMTGVRAAFIMIPLELGAFYLLRKGAFGVMWASLLIAGVLMAVFSITQIDPAGLLHLETNLTKNYTSGQAALIEDALQLTWMGRGVGTSTGAVHVAMDLSEFPVFESFYAKSVAELGLAGLVTVIILQGFPFWWALRIHTRKRGSPFAPFTDAIAACFLTFLLYNYKGFVTDLDPVNMLYWLFVGVLFSLPTIEALELLRLDLSALVVSSCSASMIQTFPDKPPLQQGLRS